MKPHRKKSSLDYSRARHAQKLKSKLKQMQVEATHKQNVKNIEKYTRLESFIYLLAFLFFLVTVLYAYFEREHFVQQLSKVSLKDKIGNLLFFLGLLFPSMASFLMRKKIQTHRNNHLEIRKLWRRITFYLFSSSFCLFVGALLSEKSYGIYYIVNVSMIYFFFLITIYSGMVAYGCLAPAALFNRYFVLFSESIRLAFWVPFFWAIATIIAPSFSSNIAFLIILTLVTIIRPSLFRIKYLDKIGFPIENLIIRAAEIKKLQLVFSKFIQKSISVKRANIDVQRELENGNYDYLQEIVKRVQEEEGKNKHLNRGKYVIVGVITFIVLSIAEGLTQDLFNEGIEAFFCKTVSLFCQ